MRYVVSCRDNESVIDRRNALLADSTTHLLTNHPTAKLKAYAAATSPVKPSQAADLGGGSM
jgi:hypothetical protein